ncbi:MAG: hypothetical protein M1815_002292 [Lichina confinis]|nr:MAG: hypothetical protein M1815_002292 [Lichina confinis]
MLVAVYPAVPPDQLRDEEEKSRLRELDWLLRSLQASFAAVRVGLEECAALLAPREPGSTLVISTHRSDVLKGFVTRVGTRVVRADMQLRLTGVAPTRGGPWYRLTLANADPPPSVVLTELVRVVEGINQSLDVVDVSTWTGDPNNASFIAGQLRLLQDTIRDAVRELKGSGTKRSWHEDAIDPKLFDPPLPKNLSFHLSLSEAALRVELRTLVAVASQELALGFRDRIAVAIGAARKPDHDEAEETFRYRGEDVRVREKVAVESQDPSLMATMTKLVALEHTVAQAAQCLATVMGQEY